MGCSASASVSHREEVVSAVSERKLIQLNLVRDEDKPFGLRLQRTSKGVLVQGINSGSVVLAWNEQHPSMQVSCGDRLVAVNGIKVDHSWTCWCSILLELRKHTVTILVAHLAQASLARPACGEEPDRLLPPNFLDSMAKHTADEYDDIVECCICLQELAPNTTVVQLPCKHAFHQGCAEKWLTQCPTFRFAKCPMCRQQLGTVRLAWP